jgi:glutathione S-transferase
MKLYAFPPSLNCYKVRLLLAFLDQSYECETIDLLQDEHKTREFLSLHPLGQVPVLVDGAATIWDSQAILVYLARKLENEAWFPLDAVANAQITAWLSFAAKELALGLAAARVHYRLAGQDVAFVKRLNIDIEKATALGHNSLEILEGYLANHLWLVGNAPTIADIACFPTVACAHEGKFDLSAYPQVQGWVSRMQQQPGYVPI